jgi:hypothetical protein
VFELRPVSKLPASRRSISPGGEKLGGGADGGLTLRGQPDMKMDSMAVEETTIKNLGSPRAFARKNSARNERLSQSDITKGRGSAPTN